MGVRAGVGVCLVGWVLGCAGAGEFAKDMGSALGAGALEGFAGYVDYREDEWGQSWNPSGRGVSGVTTRSAVTPSCEGAEDESLLYVGELLRSPASFISTLDGALDRDTYRSLSDLDFRLTGPREGGAIGIVRTTAGDYARFVLVWDERPELHDLAVYDPASGAPILRFEIPMPLAPHALVNLDSEESEPGFDLLFGPAPSGQLTLAAGQGAALSFPLGSLCQ